MGRVQVDQVAGQFGTESDLVFHGKGMETHLGGQGIVAVFRSRCFSRGALNCRQFGPKPPVGEITPRSTPIDLMPICSAAPDRGRPRQDEQSILRRPPRRPCSKAAGAQIETPRPIRTGVEPCGDAACAP